MTRFTLTVACAFGVVAATATAQECLEEFHTEDFDAYTAGLPLIPQQPCYPDCPPGFSWQPSGGYPSGGEAEVSDRFARSAPNALRIVGGDPGTANDMVHTYHDAGITFGDYQFQVDVYVPGDFVGDSYFILLNLYDPESGAYGWSTQVRWSDTGQVISDFDDGVQHEVPLIRDEWVTFRVVMELSLLRQHIIYGDALVITKSWCFFCKIDLKLEALDFFGNDATPVYYDNIRLCAVPPICPEDVDFDWEIGFADLLAVLAAWSPDEECTPRRREDIDRDCKVGLSDLLRVLEAWGACE